MKLSSENVILMRPLLNSLIKLLIFILIISILDVAIGNLLRYYYFKQTNGFLSRTTQAIEKTTASVLIFGSSKANHQYHPEIFEKRLNLSYYNAGRDGSSIFYHYAVLKSVLQRYSPKMIILDISRDFEKNQESYDRISMLLPYYKSHPEMRTIIEMKSPYEKFKLISNIYPYNSLLFSILAGNSDLNNERYNFIKGYGPLTRVWKNKIQTLKKPPTYELDSNKIHIYDLFISDCLKAGTKLYIVSSPDFIKLNFIEKSNIVADEIARKYNLRFINYSNDSLFLNNAKYFADISHLNDDGAKIFSNLIIDDIEKDLQTNKLKQPD